ncbi:winged helix-turn-helix transcriptional regulator [Kerstersia gyiorum]|uniref:winged helix-turn-helix transcriptional regulator n=1 Tax=Kerstersia gyiorum TaxID=206506 RepID=UPI003B42F342
MPSRKKARQETCPVARSVDVIGDRWSLLIVRDAFDGISRFGDFQRSLGMARNILADRLRKLVDAGIFAMQDASDGSAYQEYSLTPRGKRLFPIVVALRQWGEHHLFPHGEAHSILVDKRTGRPIAPMAPQAEDGSALSPEGTEVKKIEATDAGAT